MSFEIELPGDVADAAQWMEIGVLPGSCPSPDQLAGGVPPDGTVARVAFQKGDTTPPAIGQLPSGTYAFAAAARGNDCSVLAVGCTQTDLSEARDVSITLSDTATPVGACASGETCTSGRCAPSTGPDDPTVGTGCSMDLVGAGPLGDPLELSGTVVASAPALAVTESGFLVAYREYDPIQGAARLTVAAVDTGGALTLAPQTMLPAQCPNQDESDGIGLGYLGGAGVVVSARPACAGQPGLDGLQVDVHGNVSASAFAAFNGGKPSLAHAHALALTGASTGWLAVVDPDASAALVPLAGLLAKGTPAVFGATTPQVLAQVASTTQALALLAGDGSNLTLQLGNGPPGDAGAPAATVAASWGALAADGGRAFVLSDGATAAQPVAFQAFDEGSTTPAATGTFALPASGAAAGGDVALQGDRVFFAVGQTGAVSVTVYDHASTTPTPLRTVSLGDDVRIPSPARVSDGLVSVAANGSRVLVAWVTETNLAPDDPMGGYALFACAP